MTAIYATTFRVTDSSWFGTDVPLWLDRFADSMMKEYAQAQLVTELNYYPALRESEKSFARNASVLIEHWTTETEDMSSVSEMILHEDYQAIVAEGVRMIPFLLEELRQRPNFWFSALRTLAKKDTGEDVNPVSEEARGNLRKMAAAWVRWGEETGYI